MSGSNASLAARMQNCLSNNLWCCLPKCTSENQTDDGICATTDGDGSFFSYYVPVDQSDLAKLPYMGSILHDIPKGEADGSPTTLGWFRRFMNSLKLNGRARTRGSSCFQRFRGRIRETVHRNNKKHKGKMINFVTAQECLQESIGYGSVDVYRTTVQREEMMRNILPDEFIGITDDMTMDLDVLVYEEEIHRMRNILLDDYLDEQDIADMDDSMKAAKADEIYDSLTKSERHAICHHSFILVQDILSSL